MVTKGRADKRKLVRVEILSVSDVATRCAAVINEGVASSLKSDSRSHNPDVARVRGTADLNARVAIVTLDDPHTLNALSVPLMVQLRDAVEALCANPAVKCIVLTGADPAFCSGGALLLCLFHSFSLRFSVSFFIASCAGHLDLIASGADQVHAGIGDLKTLGGGTAEPWRFIRLQFGGMVRLITNSNQLFVAAVNGSAAGVGMAFALACDAIIASKEHASFVPAFGRLGLLPEVGCAFFFVRFVCLFSCFLRFCLFSVFALVCFVLCSLAHPFVCFIAAHHGRSRGVSAIRTRCSCFSKANTSEASSCSSSASFNNSCRTNTCLLLRCRGVIACSHFRHTRLR